MFFSDNRLKSAIWSPFDSVFHAVSLAGGTMCGYFTQQHQPLLQMLWVIVPGCRSSDTELIPAFSFQLHFTTTSVRGIAKFIIHGCANLSFCLLCLAYSRMGMQQYCETTVGGRGDTQKQEQTNKTQTKPTKQRHRTPQNDR